MHNKQNKLHFGCGDIKIAGWLNIDLDTPTADINLDLTQPLPFADHSITHIFSEHFIEHISRPEAVRFLVECRRVLSSDGIIRISTPNLRFLIATYLAGNKDVWGDLWQPDTLCMMVNEGMRSWGHQFVYDADELVRIFDEAGYNTISFQEYQVSQDEELCDLETRPFHNELIIEARLTESDTRSICYRAVKNNEDKWPIELYPELLAQINTAEKKIADQVNQITDQANLIRDVEFALMQFQNSLYGKSISAMSRLYSYIKGNRTLP